MQQTSKKSKAQTKRPSLPAELVDRFRRFFRAKWNRLGYDEPMRRFRVLVYGIGLVATVYSILHIFYELNIDFTRVLQLPFHEFYRGQVVPFLAQPSRWVGLKPGSLYQSLVPFSAVGASIWANAEFRSDRYLFLYPFPKWQRRPGEVDLKMDWSKAPMMPQPPAFLSKRSLVRVPHIVFLTYTLLGVVCTLAGLVIGFRFLIRYIWEGIVFLLGTLAFVVQYLLAPLEKWEENDAFGTKSFLAVYGVRRLLDEKLEDSLTRQHVIPASHIGTLRPLLNEILVEAGRLCAMVLVVLAILFLWRR